MSPASFLVLAYHVLRPLPSVNSIMERNMPTNLRQKLPPRKKTGETLKMNVRNSRQFNYLKRTNPELIRNCWENNLPKSRILLWYSLTLCKRDEENRPAIQRRISKRRLKYGGWFRSQARVPQVCRLLGDFVLKVLYECLPKA